MFKFFLKSAAPDGKLFELGPGLNRLGRDPANDCQISDASVSSFHCEVMVSDDAIRVRDLTSTNGTGIDGAPIQESLLHPGQTLQVGSVHLILHRELPRVAIPKFTVALPQLPPLLVDGRPACMNHPSAPALFKCPRCEQTFCDECIHILSIAGGQPMKLCAHCGTPCDRIGPPTVELEVLPSIPKPREKSFFGRITQTLRHPFKH